MSKQKSIKELIREEYKRCAIDPVHFMRRYCMIQHPMRGKIPFHLYEFQEDTLLKLRDNRYNIILKSRQMGISTLTAGYALWSMIFKEDFKVLVIATTQEVAKNLVTKVRVMHDNLPSWLRSSSMEDNKLSLHLSNGSQIKAVSSKSDSARSEALSLLVIDEAAFIDRVDDIWVSAQQTLATGGSAIMLSTPNGTGNLFHKTWESAINDPASEFNAIRLHWTLHPERDQAWRDKQDELLGPKMAAQECDCSFITSGHTVVDGPVLEWYKQSHIKDPIEKRGADGNYWLWEHPSYTANASYAVVADVARGDSSDYSAFHVIDLESMRQVAEYKGRLGTTEFGHMLVNVATEWNNALLVIENANIGWAVCQIAIDRKYENLYYSYRSDGYVDEEIQLSKGYDLKGKDKKVVGFSTNARTRPLIISKLETYFRKKVPIIHSERLHGELLTFIWRGHKAEAQQGYNDDLVMSFAIALWIRDTAIRLQQQGIELSRRSLGHFGKVQGVYTNAKKKQDEWNWNPNGQGDEDLTWLI